MTTKNNDRRIARTQQSLVDALIALILEKKYEDISIQDILGRANVGRSTFYTHHSSKESLLISGFHRLRTALLEHPKTIAAKAKGSLFAFSLALFEHIESHRHIYEKMVIDESGVPIVRRMHELIMDLARKELATKPSHKLKVPSGAAVQFTADTAMSVITWWMNHSKKLTPAEANALFRQLALPSLAAAGWK